MSLKKNTLSERLKTLRTRHTMSQQKLAENLNLSRELLSNYEQGRREPDYNTLILISNFFDVSIDYMLGVTEVEKRLLHKSVSDKYNCLMTDISGLSKESISELETYINLLKMRDEQAIKNKEKAKSS